MLAAERLWLPPGSVCGGCDAGCVFTDGSALVCSSYSAFYLTREQPEAGVRECSPRRAAEVSRHQRAAVHGAYDFRHDGMLSLHDLRS